MKNLIHSAKSVLAESTHDYGRVDSMTIAAWQIEDETAYLNARFYHRNRVNDEATRNNQNRAARRASITRLALFELIDRKAAILNDWCKVEA